MIYDSIHFPATLRDDIYRFIKTDLISEKKDSDPAALEELTVYIVQNGVISALQKNLKQEAIL